MVENFIREIDTLGNENVMAVYGGAHTRLNSIDYTGNVPNMATQLQKRYSDNIHSEDLSYLVKDIEPSRIDTIEIGGKEYQTSYFGQKNLKNLKDYKYRNFWRIEEAYEDFRNNKKIKNVLSYYSYPMLIEEGQVFMVDYTKFDGSIVRKFYRSNGRVWKNRPATEQFEVKE